jgi:hypothetical protein
MPVNVKRRTLIDRIRHAPGRMCRRCRICLRYGVRFDARWLDACFAWGWLDH